MSSGSALFRSGGAPGTWPAASDAEGVQPTWPHAGLGKAIERLGGIVVLSLVVLASGSLAKVCAQGTAEPVQVPIYVDANNYTSNRYTIWAGVGGGSLQPYLFDTGAPAMFTVVGAQGQTVTGTFEFAAPINYQYASSPVVMALGDKGGRTLATTGTVNVAAVVSITNRTTGSTTFTNGAPLEDGTYGDFGAGLYGTSSLGTILSQIPIDAGLQPGWRIDLTNVASGSGSLTIGLTDQMIAQAKNAPGAIVMAMDKSGFQIPTATGFIDGYNKAQVATTTVTLLASGSQQIVPAVFDTGGGPNVMMYDTPFPVGSNVPATLAFGSQTIFSSSSGTTPWGGSVIVSSDTAGGLRVNPGGAAIFDNYSLLFRLSANSSDTGELILVPAAVPEPATWALGAVGLGWVASSAWWSRGRRHRSRAPAGRCS